MHILIYLRWLKKSQTRNEDCISIGKFCMHFFCEALMANFCIAVTAFFLCIRMIYWLILEMGARWCRINIKESKSHHSAQSWCIMRREGREVWFESQVDCSNTYSTLHHHQLARKLEAAPAIFSIRLGRITGADGKMAILTTKDKDSPSPSLYFMKFDLEVRNEETAEYLVLPTSAILNLEELPQENASPYLSVERATKSSL